MESELRKHFFSEFDESKAKQSAVLLLFYRDVEGNAKLVLTLKQQHLGVHSGQISFPGGKYEENDVNLLTTALRESQEEIGICPDRVEIVGELSPVTIPRSGFIVHPFVGIHREVPRFILQESEVAELFEVDLMQLLHNHNKATFTLKDEQGKVYHIPSYKLGNHHVWGATAMILAELEFLLKDENMLD
jgi:8-oxo-dGTP pyrophosphatase MutT (NUDIX family)